MFRLNGSGEYVGAPPHWAPASVAKTSHAGTANKSSGRATVDNRSHFTDVVSIFCRLSGTRPPLSCLAGYLGREREDGEYGERGATAPISFPLTLFNRLVLLGFASSPNKQSFSPLLLCWKGIFFPPLLLPGNAQRVCLQKGVSKSERLGEEGLGLHLLTFFRHLPDAD